MTPEKKKEWRKRALERKQKSLQKKQDFVKAWAAWIAKLDKDAGIHK